MRIAGRSRWSRLVAPVASLAVAALAASPAGAQTIYTDRAAFEAALGAVDRYLAGDLAPQTHRALTDVGPLSVVSPSDMWLIPANAGDPAHLYAGRRAVFGIEPDAPLDDFGLTTLGSAVPLLAFGLDVGIPNVNNLIDPALAFSFDNGFSIDRPLTMTGPVGDPNKVFEFFGVIFPVGMAFTQVTIAPFDLDDPSFFDAVANNVSWDRITLAATVPEPATVVLVGGGLALVAGVGALRRRRA